MVKNPVNQNQNSEKNRRAMYVSKTLKFWVTDRPEMWAAKVVFSGVVFLRLTPTTITWFRRQVARAEEACAAGKLSVDAFYAIVKAFGPIYEFAKLDRMI